MSTIETRSVEPTAGAAQAEPPVWTPAGRFFFRFVFVYLTVYLFFVSRFTLGFVFDAIGWLFRSHVPDWDELLIGDYSFNYRVLGALAVVSTISAFIWSITDRRRKEYTKLAAWLRVAVRIMLGLTIISYGVDKVIPLQFTRGLTPEMLIQRVGDLPPMGMLWAFMAASTSYTVFAGIVEMVGGLLLVSERTTLLGALICAGALGNVVMLNFSYDVVVKTFSTHLFMMSVFLIAPDLKRLLSFFAGQAIPSASPREPILNPRGAMVARVVAAIVFVGYTLLQLGWSIEVYSSYAREARRPAPDGMWKVVDFKADGREVSAFGGSPAPWRWIIIGPSKRAAVVDLSGQTTYYLETVDRNAKKIYLDDYHGILTSLKYAQTDPKDMTLHGIVSGHTIDMALHREDSSDFRLKRGGFHWTSDYADN